MVIVFIRNELLGLAGKVKLTNPDNALCEENQNGGHHSPNGSALDEIDCIVLTETKHRCLSLFLMIFKYTPLKYGLLT